MTRKLCFLAALAFTLTVQAQPWERTLQDGSRLLVNPESRRAVVARPDGAVIPLWDGVHRLQDGRTITVRSGVVLPGAALLPAPPAPPGAAEPLPPVSGGASACLELVRKTCGLHDECATQESCGHAEQLLQLETDEQRDRLAGAAGFGSPILATTRQCQEALRDEAFFTPCPRHQRGAVPTPCERLVDRVCGADNQCEQALACAPARQLLDTEYRERAASAYPDALTEASGQCRQALSDTDLFRACGE